MISQPIENDLATDSIVNQAQRVGVVVAVCYSPDHPNGIFKQPRESAEFTQLGVVGDRHYGAIYATPPKYAGLPNTRPITVATVEATRAACARLDIPPLQPGDLGENMLVEGLGDLSELEAGDVLRVVSSDGQEAVALQVVMQNEPCVKLRQYHRLLTKELYRRRGVICVAIHEGIVRPGDRVELIRNS